jgi:hypothetical protein
MSDPKIFFKANRKQEHLAIKYTCQVSKLARWFKHSLDRHQAIPKGAFIRAYNIQLHPRSAEMFTVGR